MLTSILGEEHPSISYLKKDEISKVLAESLAKTYKQKPNDPVSFFAGSLLNHVDKIRENHKNYEHKRIVQIARDDHDKIQIQKLQEEEVLQKQQEEIQQKKASFLTEIEKSSDLVDNLQQLADYLAENTGATGVYIGKLDFPTSQTPVAEDAGDKDHIDEEAPKVIKYHYASPQDHSYMVGRVLTQEKGITHDVFIEKEEEEKPEDEEPLINADAEEDILKTFPNWVYVKEVVREPRIQFQRVPKLGCFMSVPLVYKSCLFDESLETLVSDTQKQIAFQQEQDQEREEYEQGYNTRRAEAEERGDSFTETPRKWEEFPMSPLETKDVKYVVCLDTLGQDTEFTAEQKRFTLNTIRKFRESWERSEERALHADKEKRLDLLARDMQVEADAANAILEEGEKQIEEGFLAREEPLEEEQKELEMAQARLKLQGELITTREEWKADFLDIANYKIIKMPRILQALMYFVGVERSMICDVNSNLFNWKKAATVFTEQLPQLMQNYKALGAKPEQFRAYNTINYVEKLIAEYKDQGEAIDTHHLGLGRLFKWLQSGIATRKQDITRRLAMIQKTKKEREEKQDAFKERENAKAAYLADAEENFKNENREQIEAYDTYMQEKALRESQEYGEELDEEEEAKMNAEPPELPVFESTEAAEKFDSEFEPIEIPDEVTDDIDNDWELSPEETDKIIQEYWSARGMD